MKRFVAILLAPAALFAVASCADMYGAGYGASPYYYDGYYDGGYGSVYGGYWGPDQFFYYQTQRGAPYVRDEARHFRQDNFTGSHKVHVRDWDHAKRTGDGRPPHDRGPHDQGQQGQGPH